MREAVSISRSKKKADATIDLLFIVIALVSLGIASIVIYPAFTDLNTDIQADADFPTNAKEAVSNVYTRYPSVLDALFVLAYALLTVAMIATSFFLDTHPVFFVVSVVLFIVLIAVGMLLSNGLYEMFEEDDDISALTSSFPKMYWMMTHLGHLLLLNFVLVGIALYAKSRNT